MSTHPLKTTDKMRKASSENMRKWRYSDEGKAVLRAHLKGETNPFRDPKVKAKARASLRARGWEHLNGGNGRGLSETQSIIAAALGWETEYVVVTNRGQGHHYVLDIVELDLMIDVEIDGSSHLSHSVMEKDNERDEFLRSVGWTVLRYTNKQVIENPSSVLNNILEVVKSIT